jgi:hypothetical protein
MVSSYDYLLDCVIFTAFGFGCLSPDCNRQNRILIRRVTNSSNERIVSVNGRSGAAVAAASLATSLNPNGTMRIS